MFSSLLIKPSQVDLVIYHGCCSDGFSSALASYCYFKKSNGMNSNGKTVEYFAASFNQPPPDVTGKNVLICDFSYKKNILREMISKASSLAVIDHHESAQLELNEISDEYKVFDMFHSGAYLTWKFFFPETEVPLFIEYVEDNDIWIKKMPMTEEITCYTYSLPFEFTEYEKMLDEQYIKNVAIPVGTGMKRQNDIYANEALNYCSQRFIKIDDEFFIVAYINSTVLKSEIGNRALTKFPYCDFSVIYSINGNQTTFSLRSSNEKTNVSQVATKFGGGGHRNASGMSVYNSTLLPAFHYDNGTMSKFFESNFIEINKELCLAKVLGGPNSPSVLGKYLMQITQEKINRTETRPLQKCCAVMRTKLNDPEFYLNFKALIIESQMDFSDETEYNVFCQNSEIARNLKDVFLSLGGKYNFKSLSLYNSENRIKFNISNRSKKNSEPFDFFDFISESNS